MKKEQKNSYLVKESQYLDNIRLKYSLAFRRQFDSLLGLGRKLENSKKIFKEAGRLKDYGAFEYIINRNVINQNKINLDHFSVETLAFDLLIYKLVAAGELKIIADIVTNYLGVDFKYKEAKMSIMDIACATSNIEIIKFFIGLKQNESNSVSSIINFKNDYGLGYLFYLVSYNATKNRIERLPKIIEIIDYFCELGIDLSARDADGKDIIHNLLDISYAEKKLTNFSKEIIRYLIKKGAIFKEIAGNTIEKIFLYLGEDEELCILKGLVAQKIFMEIRKPKIDLLNIQQMLYENEVDLDSVDDRGCTLLHYAAHHGHVRDLPILASSSNVDRKDKFGMAPIMYAAKNAQINDVSFLAKKGADMKTINKAGETLGHYAAGRGWIKVLILLEGIKIEGGKSFLSIKTNKGHLPIHRASYHNRLDSVKYLLGAGQDINSVNNDGDTALHIAAKEGNEEIFRYLIERGAAIDIPNKAGVLSGKIPVLEGVEEFSTLTLPLSNFVINKNQSSIKK